MDPEFKGIYSDQEEERLKEEFPLLRGNEKSGKTNHTSPRYLRFREYLNIKSRDLQHDRFSAEKLTTCLIELHTYDSHILQVVYPIFTEYVSARNVKYRGLTAKYLGRGRTYTMAF
jgi:hypothetical protein